MARRYGLINYFHTTSQFCLFMRKELQCQRKTTYLAKNAEELDAGGAMSNKIYLHMEISFLCMSFVLIREREKVCECVSVGQCETPPRCLGKSLGKTFDIPN